MVEVRIGETALSLSWEDWERRVREGRIAPDALVRADAITGGAFVRAGDLEVYQSLRADPTVAFRDRFVTGSPPILTALLVGVQVRIWWWAHLDGVHHPLIQHGLNAAAPVFEDGEVWRLITMGFLQVDWDHMLLNMLWLAYAGAALERSLGRVNLLIVYVSAVTAGSLLSLFGSPETASLGASGGVFGLIAATVVFGFVRPELLPERARRLFGVAMFPYLTVMFLMGLLSETTDNWSHFGGLITGAALAFVLDPPAVQRRPGWTTAWRGAAITAVAGTLLTLWAAGPRLAPVATEATIRRLRSPPAPPGAALADPYAELVWSAPVAWRPGPGATGLLGFVSPSPAANRRSFAVALRDTIVGQDTSDLLADFVAKTERSFDPVTVDPPTPTTLGGYPAKHALLHLGPAGALVSWTGAVRGSQALEAVWEVDAADADRLAPLRDRLLSEVIWNEPLALLTARAGFAASPTSRSARVELAEALTTVGEPEQAARLYLGLLDGDHGDFTPAWTGLLTVLARWPDAVPDGDLWFDRALAARPTAQGALAVAVALEGQGRDALALGVLELAWRAHPGDRRLRRARVQRDLPVGLLPADGPDGEPIPAHLFSDPTTGLLVTTLIPPPPSPLTLDAASVAFDVLNARQTTRVARLTQLVAGGASADDVADALIVWVVGRRAAPDEVRETRRALTVLRSLRRGRARRWAPDDLTATLDLDAVEAALEARLPHDDAP